MPLLLTPDTHTAVAHDGLPRVANYDDGVLRVLYLDGERVRSMGASDWPPPLPRDPTPEESAAAIAQREAAQQQASADAAALRQQIITLAQSAVGVRLADLTVGQRNALIAVLLWKEGALDRTGTVRPLAEWMKD